MIGFFLFCYFAVGVLIPWFISCPLAILVVLGLIVVYVWLHS